MGSVTTMWSAITPKLRRNPGQPAAQAPIVSTTWSALTAPCSVRTTAGRDRSRPVTVVRSKIRTPRSRATRRRPRARRAGCTIALSSMNRAPVIRGESAISRACSTVSGRIRSPRPRASRNAAGPSPPGPSCQVPGSDPQDPLVMEPGVDVVVGEPRSGLTDRVRHRVGVAQPLDVPEEPAQRLDVPPRRGEEAAVAPAGAAAADVLLQQRDAHRGFAGRELDRRPEPGEPPADDADVGGHVRLEGRARFAGVRAERLLEPEAPCRARVGHRQARAHVRRRCG